MALSRARLGLYILGRRAVFESVFELKPAFDILFQRSDKLALVTGEMFGEFSRKVSATYPTAGTTKVDEEEVEGESSMEGVEHLGQYVYEMTKAKVEALRVGGGEVKMIDAGEGAAKDVDEDRPENVIIPEEAVEEFGEDDEE